MLRIAAVRVVAAVTEVGDAGVAEEGTTVETGIVGRNRGARAKEKARGVARRGKSSHHRSGLCAEDPHVVVEVGAAEEGAVGRDVPVGINRTTITVVATITVKTSKTIRAVNVDVMTLTTRTSVVVTVVTMIATIALVMIAHVTIVHRVVMMIVVMIIVVMIIAVVTTTGMKCDANTAMTGIVVNVGAASAAIKIEEREEENAVIEEIVQNAEEIAGVIVEEIVRNVVETAEENGIMLRVMINRSSGHRDVVTASDAAVVASREEALAKVRSSLPLPKSIAPGRKRSPPDRPSREPPSVCAAQSVQNSVIHRLSFRFVPIIK
jgi:hypothetical protein